MVDRCNWSIVEDDALITILQEIIASGDRSDYGSFQTGTYEQIVSKMREKIPCINITSRHVQNKMKPLKDKYSAAYDMLNTSDFGWDDSCQCVTVDAPVLEEYLKKCPSKNNIANRLFPTYERLKMIFGKDRATRSLVEFGVDALENINLESKASVEIEYFNVPLSISSSAAFMSSVLNEGETSSNKIKRKVNAADDVVQLIEKLLNSMSEEMSKLVLVVGMSGLQCMSDELNQMGFDVAQSVAINMYFVDNLVQLRLWNGMNAAFKAELVNAVLMKLDM